MSASSRPLAVCIFSNEKATTPTKIELPWPGIIEMHKRRSVRQDKTGPMLGGYAINGKRCDADVPFRSLIQLDIDTEGAKDKATGRLLTITRRAPALDEVRAAIDKYEWCAASSHWHELRRGVIKYRVVILPDRDILPDEHEPLLEALDELLEGALDRGAWQWSQAFYLPSCPPDSEADAFFEHNEGAPLPVDEFVRRGREIIAAKAPASRRLTVPAHAGAAGDNLAPSTLLPPVEEMRAMLKHLVVRNCFEGRSGVETDPEGRIIKVGWMEAGMALKVAYGDEVGFELWDETHEDARARADAARQWPGFAAEAQPGHVTIGTIIKAAKDAGFSRAIQKRKVPVPAEDGASGHRSYGPFTMDPEKGLTKEAKVGRGENATTETLRISAPFEVVGACRDPSGRGWGKQIQFRDADGRLHMRHVPDAALHGDPSMLCAELAGGG